MPTDTALRADQALHTLRAHVAGDYLDLVVDLRASQGSWLADARDGRRYLDMMGFYASAPLGHNHPALADPGEDYLDELRFAARYKPSNPDFPTVIQARFVETFLRVLGDDDLPYLFFIDGGALAVENALKVAFDWKAWHNAKHGITASAYRVLHLERAFHGRSGYTMSLTNTDPAKTFGYPAFDWPRLPSPAADDMASWSRPGLSAEEQAVVGAAEEAFARHPGEIACFIAEPIQCEGGDRHLRPEFLRAMQELCHRHDALFVLDEVQTGCGVTGRPWAYQTLGLAPDLVAFGKKTQVCGVMGGRRVADHPGNTFRTPGRISSTWGGNLVDMLRATRILEVIEADRLPERAADLGTHLVGRLRECAAEFPEVFSHPRGRGLLCALDVADADLRDRIVAIARERHQVLLLGCGERTLRMRPSLTAAREDLDLAVERLRAAAKEAL
ncbi:L-lysine 6-transaminase [Microbispora sp. KK1-11]|uniref:L-lysine 6-transaminase n=1 Tax=Microbispora sp. KK1-11 TaxID=2053005 RepID=UPI00115BBA9E|nr:L-lysine 6-transaminase [Microbispora sp. KK1-11]TQS28843.1 L-lysine 6-transaminase [Microbispora sp. KK1-11]